jgi:hypothetical protein
MSISGQSGVGKIRLFHDFLGAEVPENTAVAYGTSAGGCTYSIGDFRLVGDLADAADGGMPTISKASGYARLTGTNEDAEGMALATEICFSPVLNGPLIIEARLEMQVLTARVVFVGFAGTIEDLVNEPVTSTTTTITKVVPCLGFLFDSQLTADATASTAVWHMPYLLAADTTQTSTNVEASQVAVAGESDILRLEVDVDGGARWYINGKLEQTVGAGLAATPATLLGAEVGVYSTASTTSDVDVDYLLVEANRDWTR